MPHLQIHPYHSPFLLVVGIPSLSLFESRRCPEVLRDAKSSTWSGYPLQYSVETCQSSIRIIKHVRFYVFSKLKVPQTSPNPSFPHQKISVPGVIWARSHHKEGPHKGLGQLLNLLQRVPSRDGRKKVRAPYCKWAWFFPCHICWLILPHLWLFRKKAPRNSLV